MRSSWKKSSDKGSTHRKLLWSLAALGAAGAMAGLGTFATFTHAVTPASPQQIATGKVELQIAGTTTLDVAGADLVPGDTLERIVDLTNAGSRDLKTLILTTTSDGLPPDDPARILILDIDRCDDGWVVNVADPDTYDCPGTVEEVISNKTLIPSNDLSPLSVVNPLNAMTANGTDHLRFTLTFPVTAGDNFQDQSSIVSYTFTGIQDDGETR